MTLPSWWKWEPAEMYTWDAPVGSVSVVVDELSGWCARTDRHGDYEWCWYISHPTAEVEGAKTYATEAEARRACERAWLAMERVKGEP